MDRPSRMDKWIKRACAAVVGAVSGIAAIVSYSHILELARAHHQLGLAAVMLPLSVDGLILAASLVLLLYARNGWTAPRFARALLGAGVLATIVANVLSGIAFGALAAVISAWPAFAFIACVELLMLMIRQLASQPDATAPVVVPAAPVKASKLAAPRPAADARRDTLSIDRLRQRYGDRIPSLRELQGDLNIGQKKAQAIQAGLKVVPETNGHVPVAAFPHPR
jgi:hypothetical protein